MGDVMNMCSNTKEYERLTSVHVANADKLHAAIKQVVDGLWPSAASTESTTVGRCWRQALCVSRKPRARSCRGLFDCLDWDA